MFEGFKQVELKSFDKQVATEAIKIEKLEKQFRPDGHSNNWYFRKFFITNYILNGIILSIVCYCTHALLNERFFTYGYEYIHYLTNKDFESAKYLINPMDILFPKITKCEYRRIGLSGSNETHGALCMVLLNVLNEKIFFVLWFFYAGLAIILFTSTIARFTFCLCRPLRLEWIRKTCKVSKFDAELIDADCTMGDHFMLEQISNCTYGYIFHQFIDRYVEKLRSHNINEDEEDEETLRNPRVRKMVAENVLRLTEKYNEPLSVLYEDCFGKK